MLDTAPLVALATGSEQSLGPEARRLVKRAARAGGLLGIPSVCLFEIAQLEERGRLKLRLPFEEWCGLLEEERGPPHPAIGPRRRVGGTGTADAA